VLLDVTSRASIDSAFETIEAMFGALYGLVNNAGITGRAFFEDYPEETIRAIFEVNVFGTMNVTRRALPLIRANKCGCIVNISSIGGRIGSNSVAPYVASKFAVEGFTESLAIEMKPFNVNVCVIAPGIIKTEIWDREARVLPTARNARSPYFDYFWRMEAEAEKLIGSTTLKPEDVAAEVVKVMQLRRPKIHYIVGRRAALIVSLRKLLPARIFERVYFGEFVRRMTKGLSKND
jgi:NAD(P)-dependent dehydrogenase (short-subunit alcohol dehydrogenase family)